MWFNGVTRQLTRVIAAVFVYIVELWGTVDELLLWLGYSFTYQYISFIKAWLHICGVQVAVLPI